MNLSKLKLIFSLAILASCMLFFIACDKNNGDDPTPVPSISSFSPASGAEGEAVTISGKNFSEKEADNIVKFNGTSASVTEATTTKLTVTVPAGATTGKLSVSVAGQTATSTTDFTVLQSPIVSSFSPESGMAGDTIAITGENFSAELSENTVKFGGIAAKVTSATATKLTAIVPDEAATGKITVSVDGLTVTSVNDFTVINSPAITDFSPSSGMVGDTVLIMGENFSPESIENDVKFGEVTATVVAATATQLKVIVPEGASTGRFFVTVNGQTASSGEANFKVIYPPVISGISPESGPVGTTVTITGEHFSPVLEENIIKIGAVTATVTAATTTQVTVTVPEGAVTGLVDITVNGIGIELPALGHKFTVIVPPTVSSFSPASGEVGATVTITGTNFSTIPGENTVEIGNSEATVTAATTTQLTVTVPEGAETGAISVTVDGQTATSVNKFTVVYPPVITSFSPTSGHTGDVITITGTNFSEVPSGNVVKFNGIQATVKSTTTTSIEAVVPASLTAATSKITVTTGGQTATSADDFTLIVTKVIKIAAGDGHTMFLMDDNTLWAAGANNYGQSGDGETSIALTKIPRLVMNDVKDVSAGSHHTLILKTDNTLWACGHNLYGQLGIGTTDDYSKPQQIMSDVKSIVAGPYYSLILTNNNELWACGRNSSGQLGKGEPVEVVSSPIFVMSDVKTMAAGNSHSMIVKTNNTLWTTGNNTYGQLGDGTTNQTSIPKQVMTGVKDVAAGYYHSMILKDDNNLWGCGRNNFGQLGKGGGDIHTPEFIVGNVAKVQAGLFHTAALSTGNSAYTTGLRQNGQLGDGYMGSGSYAFNFQNIKSEVSDIFTGANSTFFLQYNTVWGTGRNDSGQLGINSTSNVSIPYAVYF